MELITPGIGLVFWMVLTFAILLFILKKFAWKPILNALRDREQTIDEALRSSERVKEEMASIQAKNEALLQEAKAEKDQILREARDLKESLVREAKEKASEEGRRMIEAARLTIQSEKNAALDQIKQQVTALSIQVAEKILRGKLDNDASQAKLIDKYLDELKIN
jgi:F-type H+-transporting ATPase subunit b